MTGDSRFAVQTVALLGCATGLGRAMALAFAREGARLALGDVDERRLAEVAEAARTAGAQVETQRVDVSREEDVAGFARMSCERFGTIHLLCSNAGVNECPGPAWQLTAADWQWVMGVNLHGLIHAATHFVPIMLEQGFGHIVSTSSNSALVSVSGVAAYVASKKANLGYCEALQHDLRAAGSAVRVSVICPGKIMSDMPESARSRPAALAGRVPSGQELVAMRAFLADGGKTPEETAEAALNGIAAGHFHILTHEGDAEAVTAWAANVAQGRLVPLDAPPPSRAA